MRELENFNLAETSFHPNCVTQVRVIQKKMQSMEGLFDDCIETLFEVGIKLETKQKVLSNAEGDVGSMSRRVLLLEEEDERAEERLAKTVTDLSK